MTQSTTSAPQTASQRRIGRDPWTAGRVSRIGADLLFAAVGLAAAATTIHQGKASASALA